MDWNEKIHHGTNNNLWKINEHKGTIILFYIWCYQKLVDLKQIRWDRKLGYKGLVVDEPVHINLWLILSFVVLLFCWTY
jgi:hypothetical protein